MFGAVNIDVVGRPAGFVAVVGSRSGGVGAGACVRADTGFMAVVERRGAVARFVAQLVECQAGELSFKTPEFDPPTTPDGG